MERERRLRRGDVVGPVILVGLGVALLLINAGVWDWSVLWTLLRLWPVLLIAAGIDMLVGRRSLLGSLVALVLIVAVVGGAFWLVWTGTGAVPVEGGVEVVYPLDDAAQATVVLERAAGTLRVGALVDSPNLAEGLVQLANGEEVERSFAVVNEVATLSLQGTDLAGPVPIGDLSDAVWNLDLNGDVPLELDLDLGVGEIDLDLGDLAVESVGVEMGVGQVTVVLPPEGDFRVRVDGAIGQIIVVVPPGLAVRIQADTALVGRQFPESYERQDDVYLSPGYDRAENRVDVDLGLAIGNVVVRQAEGE